MAPDSHTPENAAMPQSPPRYTLRRGPHNRRRRDRGLIRLVLIEVPILAIAWFVLFGDMVVASLIFSVVAAAAVIWALWRRRSLRLEVDEVVLDEQTFTLHRFDRSWEYPYREVESLVTFIPNGLSGTLRLAADLRSLAGIRIGRIGADFSHFEQLIADLRRRLDRAGAAADSDEKTRAERWRRRRLGVGVDVAAVLLLLALFGFLGCAVWYEEAEMSVLRERGITADATIVRHYSKIRPLLDIRFADRRGVKHIQSRDLNRREWGMLAEGDSIIVTYLPDDPEISTVRPLSEPPTPLWALLLAVLVPTTLALAFLIMSFKGYALEYRGGRCFLLRPGEVLEDRL